MLPSTNIQVSVLCTLIGLQTITQGTHVHVHHMYITCTSHVHVHHMVYRIARNFCDSKLLQIVYQKEFYKI